MVRSVRKKKRCMHLYRTVVVTTNITTLRVACIFRRIYLRHARLFVANELRRRQFVYFPHKLT